MSDTNQFKRQPRRKAARGKSVVVSEELKKAYTDLANERAAKEQAIGRHLPPDMKR
jgi:hypothetical protein